MNHVNDRWRCVLASVGQSTHFSPEQEVTTSIRSFIVIEESPAAWGRDGHREPQYTPHGPTVIAVSGNGGQARDDSIPGADRRLRAHDSGQVYQAAGDQYFYDRSAPAPATVTNTLPRDTPAFTGRERELRTLITRVEQAAASGEVIPVHAIDGMPGIGKTALAVHAGYHLAGGFPDGQFFVDLRAHTTGQGAVEPADALFGLLCVDGMPPDMIPVGLDERAARWRARMAGKRALLIMDNAADYAQVESLLPGAAGCLVLITSRRRLTGLGVRHAAVTIALGTLPSADASALFVQLAGRNPESEPSAVAELVRLCGYLPLAIALLAAKLCPEPLWRVQDMVEDLAATKDRLAYLHSEDVAVAAAFELSYRALPPDRQHFFRRLGLHPGIEIDAYAAAALSDIPPAESQRHLEALYSDRLIDQPVRGRYRMHELIGDYTRRLAGEDSAAGGAQAVARLLDYYRYAADIANRQLSQRTPAGSLALPDSPAAVPALSQPNEALAWMRRELANLLACAAYAHIHGDDARLAGIAAALAAILRRTGPWRQAIALHRAAVAAAERLGDRPVEADALLSLGIVQRRAGEYAEAARSLNDALALFGRLDDRLRIADLLNELATVHQHTDDYAAAEFALNEALAIYHELGDLLGQAVTLDNLAAVRWVTDDFPAAIDALQEALAVHRVRGDRCGQAKALFYLGVVSRMTGDYAGATQVLSEALAIYQEVGDRLGTANVRFGLGVVCRIVGDTAGAKQALQEALVAYRDLGDRLGQANACRHLGLVRQMEGDLSGAMSAFEEALALYRDLGDRLSQAGALYNHGFVVWQSTRDYPRAAAALRDALAIYEELGSRQGQAEVHNVTGAVLLDHGRASQAMAEYQRALRLAREAQSPIEEARAYEGTGQCALRRGKTDDAVGRLRRALEIYRRIRVPDAARVAAQIEDLVPPLAS
jgi:tetratricopeptide (TPR) repeat protein